MHIDNTMIDNNIFSHTSLHNHILRYSLSYYNMKSIAYFLVIPGLKRRAVCGIRICGIQCEAEVNNKEQYVKKSWQDNEG